MLRLLSAGLGLLAVTPVLAAPSWIGSDNIQVTGALQQSDLRITEQHHLVLTQAWEHPARTYGRSPLPGLFPWTQDLTDFEVVVDGKPQSVDVVRYGQDRVMVRFPTVTEGARLLEVRYTIVDIRGAGRATLPQWTFWDLPARVERWSVRLDGLPADAQLLLADRYDATLQAQRAADGTVALTYPPEQGTPPSPELQVTSAAWDGSRGVAAYARHAWTHSPLFPWVVLLVVLMVLLRWAPVRAVLGLTAAFMFVPLVFWLSRAPAWLGYFAARRGVDSPVTWAENFYGELAADVAVALVLFMLAWHVVRSIRRAEVTDYDVPYEGLVGFLVLQLFVTQDPQAALLLPLAAFFPVLYASPGVTQFFGANVHVWMERVIASGRVGFDELSRASGLTVDRLNRIFAALPTHPVAVDHNNRQYLSADVLAALESAQFCNNCGGTLRVEHVDLLQCPYCSSDYAVAMQKNVRVENIPPLLVTSLARFCGAFGGMVLTAFVVLAVFGAGTELYGLMHRPDGAASGDWATVVVVAVLGGIAYAVFAWAAARLTSGGGYLALLVMLTALGPCIWPLVALRELRSLRARFFFGRLDVAVLRAWLAEKKFLTLPDLALRLRCSELDAMNLAHQLTSTGALDAVYDRRNNSLTERALFRANAAENSCQACGGVVSVLRGTRACRYCGTPAPSSVPPG